MVIEFILLLRRNELPRAWVLGLLIFKPSALLACLDRMGAVLSEAQRAALCPPARARDRRQPPPGHRAGNPLFVRAVFRHGLRLWLWCLRRWPSLARFELPMPVQWLLAGASFALLATVMTTAIPLWGQSALGIMLLVVGWLVKPGPTSARPENQFARLVLTGLALVLTGRYIWWRLSETLHFDTIGQALAGGLLLLAESYFWLVMALSHLQIAWPLRRPIAAMAAPPHEWPHVDIFIPTYNEPLSVVRPTVLAAQDLDWPADRLHVWLLDDGRRDSFAEFAADAGTGYLRRPDGRHAKAGNINHALVKTGSEYVAIFDCDHIVSRDFLQSTMGWMVKRRDCAMVQTPHFFFSKDPIERNLRLEPAVPNEGRLFYGLVQNGNDLWDAAFFCGSCAVLRRSALHEIGGIAVETVTEDAHTALKLHRHGYSTAYVPNVLAAGLATESLADHIGQRIRWARGLAQIFRVDNPLRGAGLSLMQRMCYLSAMLHFFYGLPRLILLCAPLAYMLLGPLVCASIPALLIYLLPQLLMSKLFDARVRGAFRARALSDVYELLLAWFIMRPVLTALLAPGHGTFNVTDKGRRLEVNYLDWRVAWPYFLLIASNALAVVLGASQLSKPHAEVGAILINVAWAVYNLMMLGLTIHVARETRQIRSEHRFAPRMDLPARLRLGDGTEEQVRLVDFSLDGVGLQREGAKARQVPELGTSCQVQLHDGVHWHSFPGRIARDSNTSVGVRFTALSLAQQTFLLRCTFSRRAMWEQQCARQGGRAAHPWRDFYRLLCMAMNGYRHVLAQGLSDAIRHWRLWRKARQGK